MKTTRLVEPITDPSRKEAHEPLTRCYCSLFLSLLPLFPLLYDLPEPKRNEHILGLCLYEWVIYLRWSWSDMKIFLIWVWILRFPLNPLSKVYDQNHHNQTHPCSTYEKAGRNLCRLFLEITYTWVGSIRKLNDKYLMGKGKWNGFLLSLIWAVFLYAKVNRNLSTKLEMKEIRKLEHSTRKNIVKLKEKHENKNKVFQHYELKYVWNGMTMKFYHHEQVLKTRTSDQRGLLRAQEPQDDRRRRKRKQWKRKERRRRKRIKSTKKTKAYCGLQEKGKAAKGTARIPEIEKQHEEQKEDSNRDNREKRKLHVE